MLKSIMVDFDGTLVDTASANVQAYAAALAEVGVAITASELGPLIDGRSWRTFLPQVMPAASEVEWRAVAKNKRRLYPRYFDQTTANHVLIELLRQWKQRYALALVTTASRDSVVPLLNLHGVADLFDLLVCGEDVVETKPSPEAYFKAATQLSVKPNECLVIEDSNIGVAAAQAFGGHIMRWESAPFPDLAPDLAPTLVHATAPTFAAVVPPENQL
jgi:beta-phosphoglucomutase